jgi:hypothetical protein
MTRNQALTVAEDAIVSALSAVGEIMPASVRDLMIAASALVLAAAPQNPRSAGPRQRTGRGSHQSYCVMMVCSSTMMSQ